MRRREVVVGLAWLTLCASRVAAQERATPVIGVLGSASADAWDERLQAFRDGLKEAGYTEGNNVALEYRWAEGHNERLPALAADLVRRSVSVIVVLGNTPSTLAAKAATATIPVVFRVAADPVELGLVASLGRPGRNLTGVTTLGIQVGAKQLELLHEFVPTSRLFGVLVNPTNPALADILRRELLAAAGSLGVQVRIVEASTDADLIGAFAALRRDGAGGLVIGADAFFNSRNKRLADLGTLHAVPTISPYREFSAAGGLMSYGGSVAAASRQAGVYTGRILKGEKPGDLPVQQADRIELVINAVTARALGVAVPDALRDRADEMIE